MKRDSWLDQAFREVGDTDVSRRAATTIVLLFAGLIVGIGVVEWSRDSSRQALSDMLRASASAVHRLATGPLAPGAANGALQAAIDRTETGLEDESWLSSRATPTVQALLTRLGSTTHPQVIPGPRDESGARWLAYRPGVDYVLGAPFLDSDVLRRRALAGEAWQPRVAPDPRPAIRHFADALASQGIGLLAVPTPTKIMLHPEAIGARPEGSAVARHNPSFSPMVRALQAAGVTLVDAASILDAEHETGDAAAEPRLFLRRDSHWTPVAVDRVAAAIAVQLAAEVDLGPKRAWSRIPETRAARGDLTVMLAPPSARSEDKRASRADAMESVVVDRVTRPRTDEAAILLLGDSFSGIYADERLGWGTDAGLADQLAFHLGRDVASLTVQGGGVDAARRRFAEAYREGRYPNLRWVVWQFAVRELSSGTWPLIALETPKARDAHPLNGATVTGAATVRVTGTVAARGRAPRPGETPYPDALIALHMIDVRADDGTTVPESILVYTWGLRDNRPTGGDRITIGTRLTVGVVPWRTVASRFDSIERRELLDPALLQLEAYWMQTDDANRTEAP